MKKSGTARRTPGKISWRDATALAINGRYEQIGAGGCGVRDVTASIDNVDATFGDEFEREWIDFVLNRKNARGECFGCVGLQNRNRALGDDGPGIHLRDHKMNSRTV